MENPLFVTKLPLSHRNARVVNRRINADKIIFFDHHGIFETHDIDEMVYFPSPAKITWVDEHGTYMCVLLVDGSVHMINIDELGKSYSQNGRSTPLQSKESDIFSNLLDSADQNNDSDTNSLFCNSIGIFTDSRIVVCTGNLMLTLAPSNHGYTVTQNSINASSDTDNNCVGNTKQLRKFELGDRITHFIPDESPQECINLEHSGILTLSQVNKPPDCKEQFCILIKYDNASSAERTTSKHEVIIENELFTALCGADASLLACPVLVLGAPSGRVYSLPLSCGADSQHVLYDVQQCAAGIFGIKWKSDAFLPDQRRSKQPGHVSDALLIVGVYGNIVVIYMENAQLMYHTTTIPGPVNCACVLDGVLVHSTLTDLHLTWFHKPALGAVTSGDVTKTPQMAETISLGFYNVVQLEVPNQGGVARDKAEVMAMTTHGHLYSLQLNLEMPVKSDTDPPCNDTSGLSVKELLTSITAVEKQTERMREITEAQNSTLQQLSLCCHLQTHHLRSQLGTPDSNPGPLRFTAHIECRELGFVQQYTFVLTVLNQSEHVVKEGMYVRVNLQSISEVGQDRGEGRDAGLNTSEGVMLGPLTRGQKQYLLIPISNSGLMRVLPLIATVTCTINAPQYTFSDPPCNSAHSTTNHITVPVFTRRFDVIDFLRTSNQSIASAASQGTQNTFSLVAAIEQIARQRPCFQQHVDNGNWPTKQTSAAENLTCNILIDKTAIQGLLGKDYKKAVRSRTTKEVAVRVLNSLVARGEEGNASVACSEPLMRSTTPANQQATISVNAQPGDARALQLCVQTCAVSDLVHFLHAFTARIQAASAGVRTGKKPLVVNAAKHRTCLVKLQELSSEIEALMSSTSSASPGDVTRRLKQLYSALRQVTY